MNNLLQWYARKTAGKKDFTLWQADNHPIEVYSPKVVAQKMAYIHFNPVRAGLVAEAEHYIHSSASNYSDEKSILDITILDTTTDYKCL